MSVQDIRNDPDYVLLKTDLNASVRVRSQRPFKICYFHYIIQYANRRRKREPRKDWIVNLRLNSSSLM